MVRPWYCVHFTLFTLTPGEVYIYWEIRETKLTYDFRFYLSLGI